jgi:hypothetical protein
VELNRKKIDKERAAVKKEIKAVRQGEGVVNRTPTEFQEYVLRTAEEFNSPPRLVGMTLETRDTDE